MDARMELDQVLGPSNRSFDRHLLITLTSPKSVPPEYAAQTGKQRPPMAFVAVLDISGSMQGEKLEQAKEAVRRALHHLRDDDVFSLVTFEANVRCVVEPVEMDENTRRVALSALNEIRATGMTALDGGLLMGIEKARLKRLDSTLVLLLSDGQANVGETNLEKVGYRATLARQEGILVSTIGVGFDYNEALMSEIAIQGGGRFYHVTSAAQIPAYVAGELGEVAMLAARDLQITLDLPAGAVVVPFSAAYPASQDGSTATIKIGDIPSDTELEIPIRLTLQAQLSGARLPVDGSLTHRTPAGSTLSASLNRVTVRIAAAHEYQLREGLVKPVAENVFKHMKAAQALNLSRAYAVNPTAARDMSQKGVRELHEYANILGEDRLKEEEEKIREYGSMPASPAAAKQRVNDAYQVQRSSKKFDKS
jgi:Ca-activated chloride channel family protein